MKKIRTGNPDKRRGLEKALLPILGFAARVSVLCSTAAGICRAEFISEAVLLGLGGFAIVIGTVACLLVLLKRIDRD